MTFRERFLSALTRKPVDRVPVGGVLTSVTQELQELCGVYYPEVHCDPEQMAQLACAAFDYCGVETAKLPFDMTVECAALGGKIRYGDRATLPQVTEHIFESMEDFSFDPAALESGRAETVYRAAELCKKRYRDGPALVTSIVGPFTLAGKLFGLEELLIASFEEPELCLETLMKVTEMCKRYALLQEKAGADAILIGEATCSGDLIPSSLYENLIAPCHKELAKVLSIPSIVHICGRIGGHLESLTATGLTAVSFDAKTDYRRACAEYKGKIALVGAVDVVETLRRGTPERVYAESRDCVLAGVDVLAAGCAWPSDTPLENIKAHVRAARTVTVQ